MIKKKEKKKKEPEETSSTGSYIKFTMLLTVFSI